MVMELFRPFIFQNLRMSIGPLQDTRPEDIFRCSCIRMVEITRLYYAKFRNSPAAKTMCWFIAPVYTANISLQGSLESFEQRRHDFELCMRAFMGFGAVQAMKEQLVRGAMAMAVYSKLFSKVECRQMLLTLHFDKGPLVSASGKVSTLTMDFERAVEAPRSSSVEVLADEFKTIMAVEDS